ncbi:hypothetical protein ASPCAL08714 [Aspergillus calidoustus]|uniref:Uncharacterized protein n=1 Tax=Aspergillus calidoustus TaxID=454130 RepID=A0A0U5GTZ7_ASPCI|nr:hypothetical protein ASPCAL08714 [Aspergillus calidoustus]
MTIYHSWNRSLAGKEMQVTVAALSTLTISQQQGHEEQEQSQMQQEKRALAKSTAAPTLTFSVRPYFGWTRRLEDQCVPSPSFISHPTLLVEGPYGYHISLHGYNNALMITGGTGIRVATA